MSDPIQWLDHDFAVCQPGDDWNEVAGLYIFAALDSAAEAWIPLWIGQALSFAERLPNHEKWPEAEMLGATHVHARVEPDESRRLALEKELIQYYQPHLNVQLK